MYSGGTRVPESSALSRAGSLTLTSMIDSAMSGPAARTAIALLAKGPGSPHLLRAPLQLIHVGVIEPKALLDRSINATERQLLRHPDSVRSVSRDRVGNLTRSHQQLIGLHNPADQSNPPRFLGVDELPGEQQEHGVAHPNNPGQAQGAVAMQQIPLHLGRSELGARRRDPDVALERELKPPGERVAVDRRDQRLRNVQP